MNPTASVPARPLWQREWLVLPAVLAVAAAGTLALRWAARNTTAMNQRPTDLLDAYHPMAEAMVRGTFFQPDGTVLVHRPPGYPLLLATVYRLTGSLDPRQPAAVWAQRVLMWLTLIPFYLLIRSACGGGWALAASLGLATYPFFLFSAARADYECFYTPFFMLAVLLFHRGLAGGSWWLFAASGLVFGWGSLIRPFVLYLPLFLVLVVLALKSWRPRAGGALIMLAAYVLALLPWLYLSNRGRDELVLMRGARAFVFWDGLHSLPGWDIARRAQQREAQYQVLDSVADFGRFLREQLRDHPAETIGVYLYKIGLSWYGTDSGLYQRPILLVQLVYLMPAVWGAYAAWRRPTWRALWVLSAACIVYHWGIATVTLSCLRYLVPVMGLVVFFGVAGLTDALRRARLRWSC